jgi:predicted nucleic acid-binding protein
MIVLDTSAMFAAIDSRQRMHEPCAEALAKARAPLLLSPFVLAELDYLVTTRVGVDAELALLDEVARGAYELATFTASEVATARKVVERYADLEIGLADASIVVLAARHKTRDVLTLDKRHFRALRTLDRKPFRVLP